MEAAREFEHRAKVVAIRDPAVDTLRNLAVTEDLVLQLEGGGTIQAFDASDFLLTERDIGRDIRVVLAIDCSDGDIKRIDRPERSFRQSGHQAEVQGLVRAVDPHTSQRWSAWVDTGHCNVRVLTNHEFHLGDSLRAEGRLTVVTKRSLP